MDEADSARRLANWRELQLMLQEVTLQMRDCARSEQWELIAPLAQRQTELVAELGSVVPDEVVQQLGAAAVETDIRLVAEAHAEAVSRLEAWQQEMSQSMRQMEDVQTNVNRLSKAYR